VRHISQRRKHRSRFSTDAILVTNRVDNQIAFCYVTTISNGADARASHAAAGNAGRYPYNGAIRVRCERSCAELIVENDADWARIVG